MNSRPSYPSRWSWFSPWVILGSAAILAAILLVLAITNVHREEEFMKRTLLSEANVLMRSLEAGSRTGMMGMGWGHRQIQVLMEETAQQPDVLYVAMVDTDGRVLAHSKGDLVGTKLSINLPGSGQTSYRFIDDDQRAFEVIRAYQPWFRQNRSASCPWDTGMPHGSGGFGGHSHGSSVDMSDRYMLVGLDPAPFEAANRQDLYATVLLFGIMFLIGAAGFSSLVWAQHYRTTRRSLQQIKAFTETIINQMPVGLLTTDQQGNIQIANEAARVILRRPDGLNDNLTDIPCFVPLASKLRNEPTVVEQEVLWPASDSLTIPLLVNATVIRDGDRSNAGYAFLFSDMTNIKQLEEQLWRSERLASLGRVAAGIAHEIRNPLSSIKGFATILARRCGQDERNQQLSQVMIEEVERLNRVVTELLDFARPTELQKRPTPLKEFINNTLRLIEKDAEHQGVKVETSVTPETLRAEIDPDRFSQVLLNLYLNALQAVGMSGTIKVKAFFEKEHINLQVSDSGKGIMPEDLPRIFDPYFTTKPRGVGLGLANVHKIIEAHGGEVDVHSNPGEGTRFTIRLDAAS
jgi:two-component system, NtrC family, sensor histidine kinase HydH